MDQWQIYLAKASHLPATALLQLLQPKELNNGKATSH